MHRRRRHRRILVATMTPRPLSAVLREVMLIRSWAVFQKGVKYVRIDELFRGARHDEAMHPLLAGNYWIWEDDGTGKLVIRFVKDDEDHVEFAEVGSELVPPE